MRARTLWGQAASAGAFGALLMLALNLAALPGCNHPDHVQTCAVWGNLNLDMTTLNRGEVLAFRVIPVDNDGKVRKKRVVSLRVGESSVLGVSPLDHSRETCRGPNDSRWYFVIYGIERGETFVEVSVDGKRFPLVPVVVR